MTTWRDLSDMLTAEQIAVLEYCEAAQVPPGLASPQRRLNCAQLMAGNNLIQHYAPTSPPLSTPSS